MKIAIDARYMESCFSGITRYALNLLEGIREAGPDYRIYVLKPKTRPLPEEILESSCFEFIDLPSNPRKVLDQIKAPRVLNRLGIDFLHSVDAFAPLRARCRKLISIHDVIPIVCRRMMHGSIKARYAWIWKSWLKIQARGADAVLTGSRHSANDIANALGIPEGKIRVVEDGVPAASDRGLPHETPYPNIKGKMILYVGRRDPYKNIVGLIRAFAALRKNFTEPVTLVIVGVKDDRYREPEEEVSRLGLAESVVFTGHVTDSVLEWLYREASVFAFPSLYEGFGLPPLEAMNRGTPVVASNRSCMPEVLGNAAILVDPTDPEAMASAIARVLSEKRLAETLTRKGRMHAASYSLKRQGEKTLRVYEELAARSR